MDKKEKQKFGKDMSDEEVKRVMDHRSATSKPITQKNPVAFKLACLACADYNKFLDNIGASESLLFGIVTQKKKIDRNQVDRAKGKTDQLFTAGAFQGETKTIQDLDSDDIVTNDVLFKNLESLRQALTNVYYGFVGVKRTGDLEVFFDEENFNKYVERIVNKLRQVGIDLFLERQKQMFKD